MLRGNHQVAQIRADGENDGLLNGSSARPTGTVTFLFSDIEGSTVRWDRDRAAMQDAVRCHDALLQTAIAGHGGYVFKTIGDAFCAAFWRTEDAIAAILDAQRALAAKDFSAIDGLRVRAAVHTGTADERNGDYYGPALNRVARLLAIGHGGQVLVSGVARDLAHSDLPAGALLVDLGSHRLKDLAEAEHVWQLTIEGLPAEFPALKSLDTIPNNLPIARTSLLGREQEVMEVKDLVEHHGLLTLVGSGGVGKTRLAIQLGAELLDRYPDGAWFVDLGPIGDPELVPSVVAQALGMSQQQGRQVDEAIPQWLRRKKLLLIFDNCEHVLEPVAALADAILGTARDVHILATSRQGLDVSGEAVHRLPALAVPAETAGLQADEALRYGAVTLFADRAHAADARFVLTNDNAPIVAEICRRLDGIALAIELAAARVKVLSIPSLAQRLDERFKLLTGGSRDVLPRQKTLTALIDWSYDLLTTQEQLLFARLGVFAGGFRLGAATAVCGGGLGELDILDLLGSLTDKSLILADTSGERERYSLLESMAAYALEKLDASGGRERWTRRHAEYFRDQLEAARTEAIVNDERLGSRAIETWLAGAELELDNYRTALEWALTQNNDAVLGGAIAGALHGLWHFAGLIAEGRYWIELALPRVSEAEQPAIAARLQLALAALLVGKRACEAAERAITLFESVGDLRGAVSAQRQRGHALWSMGQLDEARDAMVQALGAHRAASGEAKGIRFAAACLAELAAIEATRGDLRAGRELHAQARAGFKAVGDELGAADVLALMAELEFAAGDPAQALRLMNESIELQSLAINRVNTAIVYTNSAAYCIALGDLERARESAREGLRRARRVQAEGFLSSALQHLALLAALGGSPRRAAQLLGYVDAEYEQFGIKRQRTDQWGYDKLSAALRELLSEGEIEKLAAEGAAWPKDLAVEEALKV